MTRKPKDRLTLEKGLALAKERNMDPVCVGQALALLYWMDRMELNALQLARLRGSSPSSIYQVLNLEWAPSMPWWSTTAKALGMELWHLNLDAWLLLRGKPPLPAWLLHWITRILAEWQSYDWRGPWVIRG